MAKDFSDMAGIEAAVADLRNAVNGNSGGREMGNGNEIQTADLSFSCGGGSPEAIAYANAIMSQQGGIERGAGMALA